MSCFVYVCVCFWNQLIPLHALVRATLPLSQSPWCLVCVSLFSPCSLRLAAFTAALALDTLSSVATNSDTATATVQDSPSSETTTLTCSLSTPANDPSDPSPTPVPAPAPTPESNTAPPTPLFSTSVVEAKMAPLVEQRGSNTQEEQGNISTPPCTPERTKSQKSGTPIPPKRRHSPKLAALNKASPPVSPLATSSPSFSPTFDIKKPAPAPPITQHNTQPHTVALDTETPAQTASTHNTTAPFSNPAAPDVSGHSLTTFDDNKVTDQNVTPSVIHGALTVQDATKSAPLPVTQITSNPAPTAIEAPLTNDIFISPTDTYDFLTPDVGPQSADLELELRNGTDRPFEPPADLISLDSPPSLANGDAADLPSGPVLEASETLAKTAPPVNDEYGSL